MRRTKEWWASLEKWERQWLVEAEYWQNRGGGYGAGGYLPDDCSECSVCGQAQLGSGMCGACGERMTRIINKADEAVSRDHPLTGEAWLKRHDKRKLQNA